MKKDNRTIAGGGTLKLEVGKSYKDRSGVIKGPLWHDSTLRLCKFGASGQGIEGDDRTWDIEGSWNTINKQPEDLVELVEDGEENEDMKSKERRELEELVRKANEGDAAMVELSNRHDRSNIEYSFGKGDPNWLKMYHHIPTQFRIKPEEKKPAFETFLITGLAKGCSEDDWEVKHVLDEPGVEVTIGCRKFRGAADLCEGLKQLRDGNWKNWDSNDARLTPAGAKGFKDQDGNVVSWADCDRIIAALEKIK